MQVSGFEDGHTYTVYRIGKYAAPASDAATSVAVIATDGASDAVKTAAKSAADNTADPLTNTPPDDTGDYVAWAAGLLAEGETNLYSGDLRKVANYLTSTELNASGVAVDQAATDAIKTAIEDKTDSATISVAEEGWYVITNDYTATGNTPATGVSTIVGTKYGKVPGAQGLAELKPTNGNNPGDNTKDNLQKKMEGAVIKGSTATFTITSNMPDTKGWTKDSASYKFVDHASKMISVIPSTVKVTIGDVPIDPAAVVTPDTAPAEGTAQDYTIDISDFVKAHLGENKGAEIKVTYDAKVLETADPDAAKAINSVDIYKNGVKVPDGPYDPNPGNPGTDTQITSGPNSGLKILKTDVNGKPLEKAEFKLTNAAGTVTYADSTPESAGDAMKTDADGVITIPTLGVGAYKLVETKAPGTFNTPSADDEAVVFNVTADVEHENDADAKTQIISIKVGKPTFEAKGTDTNSDNFTTADKWDFLTLAAATDAAPATVTMKNVQNISQLPLTGAAGVILFVIIAVLLAGGATVMVMVSKRNKKAGMAI